MFEQSTVSQRLPAPAIASLPAAPAEFPEPSTRAVPPQAAIATPPSSKALHNSDTPGDWLISTALT